MRRFRNSNSSILQPELASRNFRNSDVPSYLTAPPSYSSEEWSPDLDQTDAVIDDHRAVANEEADSDNNHPTPTYTEIRSPTSIPTHHETLVDVKTSRFAYATHPRALPSATSSSISGNFTSGSYMTVRDSPTALHGALPFSSNAVIIGWNASNSATTAASNVPIRYILSPHSPNFILVLSSSDAADTRPLYRISVNSNCFIPSSYVTTIRRGGSEDGEFVGDFEMGDSLAKWTISIGEHQMLLRNIMLPKVGGPHVRASLRTNARSTTIASLTWDWDYQGTNLRWSHVPNPARSDDYSKIMICHHILQVPSPSTPPTTSFQKFKSASSSTSKTELVLVATFDPADPSSWGEDIQRRPKELVIYPEGSDMMDLVLLSMMVAERMRLMLPS